MSRPFYYVFTNLVGYDDKRGIMYPLSPYEQYSRCIHQCQLFGGEDAEYCRSQCFEKSKQFRHAIAFAKTQCPNGDPICCKQKAQDNDLAYLYCISKKNIERNKKYV